MANALSQRENIKVDGHKGRWYVIDEKEINNKNYYLLEHETYGDEVPCICIDDDGKLVVDEICNGYDDVMDCLKAKAEDEEEKAIVPYSFWVYSNEEGKSGELLLWEAAEEYKNRITNGYKSLGVTKNGGSSCDIMNNLGENGSNKISDDYKSMENLKDDNMIKINLITLLKTTFKL